jgi:hypothetical protein
MPDEHGNETREEAEERIRIVRATQIFGDTPTDPNVAAAAVAAEAEEGNDEAADLSPEEAKRQLEPSAEELEEGGAEVADEDDSDSEEDEGDRKAADVISDIESADSADEVDRLSEGDDRVTVKRAADKRKEELSE